MIVRALNHYHIAEKLGSGGMGEVYLAEDARLGRKVAVKILPAALAADPILRERLATEARAVAALNHPNIVTIHFIEEAEGTHFLTMELVEGKPLAETWAFDATSARSWKRAGSSTAARKRVTFHTLRHSMASIALNAGVPEGVVQQLGNWKTRTMVARYAHHAAETMRDAAGKVAALVAPGAAKPPAEKTESQHRKARSA